MRQNVASRNEAGAPSGDDSFIILETVSKSKICDVPNRMIAGDYGQRSRETIPLFYLVRKIILKFECKPTPLFSPGPHNTPGVFSKSTMWAGFHPRLKLRSPRDTSMTQGGMHPSKKGDEERCEDRSRGGRGQGRRRSNFRLRGGGRVKSYRQGVLRGA